MRREAGITKIELIVTVGICAVLVLMLIPPTSHSKHGPGHVRISCAANLQGLGWSFNSFSILHGDYPFEISTNRGGSRQMTNDIAAHFKALDPVGWTYAVCPALRSRIPVTTSSNSIS